MATHVHLRIRSGAVRLVALSFLAPTLAAGAEPPPEASLASILGAWEQIDATRGPVRLQWRQSLNPGTGQFSRFLAEWATPDGASLPSVETSLHLDGNRFRVDGRAFAPEQYADLTASLRQQVPLMVRTHRAERFEADWIYHRQQFFIHPGAEVRPLRPIVRAFDGAHYHHYWPRVPQHHPQATIAEEWNDGLPDAGGVETVSGLTERLARWDTVSALAAMAPGQTPGLDLHGTDWTISGLRQLGASQCLQLVRPSEAASERFSQLWVDPGCGWRVRRWMDRHSDRDIQIDINYRSAGDGEWQPVQWSVVETNAAGDVIQAFVTSEVIQLESASTLDAARTTIEYEGGTLVDDRSSHQRYLVLMDGSHRVVTPGEILWLPTRAELMATPSGKVGELVQSNIERQLRFQRWWRPVSLAGVLAAGLIVAWHRRRCNESVRSTAA